jgi:hypothetical protein
MTGLVVQHGFMVRRENHNTGPDLGFRYASPRSAYFSS